MNELHLRISAKSIFHCQMLIVCIDLNKYLGEFSMAKINLLKLKAKIECKSYAFSFTGRIMESMKCIKCAKPINLHESTYLTILLFRNNCLLQSLMFYVKFKKQFQISNSKDFCCKNCLNILTGYKRINYHILINLTHSEWCSICHRISWKNWA